MIVKDNGKYIVKDAKGEKVFGTHETRARAMAQLRAIEKNKKKIINKKMWKSMS